MALNWNWSDKMGTLTIKQKEKTFDISIYDGNCLAIFLYEYKDEQGEEMYSMYSFLMDKQHVKNITKNKKSLFGDDVIKVDLDLKYDNARILLDIFIKQGYDVTAHFTPKD